MSKRRRSFPTTVQPIVQALAATELSSLLDEPERYPLDGASIRRHAGAGDCFCSLLDAHRRIEALAMGEGCDIEYPRDLWRLCNLGIDQPEGRLSSTSPRSASPG